MFTNIDINYSGAVVHSKISIIIASLSVLVVVFFVSKVLINYPVHDGGIQPLVEQTINLSGVTNPVTAVLLNFRAYDTLLELAVLLIAVIAVLPKNNTHAPSFQYVTVQQNNLVVDALQRWIIPASILFAGYLLWAGASQPGGAFQAGALLASGCVLMLQADRYRMNDTSLLMRIMLIAGLAVFILVGLLLAFFNGNLLYYPEQYAGLLILIIESFATLSIAIALASLYLSLIQRITLPLHTATKHSGEK